MPGNEGSAWNAWQSYEEKVKLLCQVKITFATHSCYLVLSSKWRSKQRAKQQNRKKVSFYPFCTNAFRSKTAQRIMRLRVEHSGEKALKISHLTFLAANILVMIVARKFKYSAFENKHSSRFGRDVLKGDF